MFHRNAMNMKKKIKEPKAPVEKEKEDVCEFCGGDGFITLDEDDGEGHTRAGVGQRRCVCKNNFNEDDQDN